MSGRRRATSSTSSAMAKPGRRRRSTLSHWLRGGTSGSQTDALGAAGLGPGLHHRRDLARACHHWSGDGQRQRLRDDRRRIADPAAGCLRVRAPRMARAVAAPALRRDTGGDWDVARGAAIVLGGTGWFGTRAEGVLPPRPSNADYRFGPAARPRPG